MPSALRAILLVSLVLAGRCASPLGSAQEGQPPPPEVNARKFVILSDFNEVLYEHNAHERIAPASLTKMMTAIVAVRTVSLDLTVTIEESDLIGEATMGLVAGDQVTIEDLLYGLLMPSGNDAAMAIARAVGTQLGATDADTARQIFVDRMNETARLFQLRNTHYMNPHGLDQDGHYSTAYDQAIILRAALNYPQIRGCMQTLSRRVADRYDLYNGNQLLAEREDYIGGKTGLTDNCGYCLAGAARNAEGRMVIAVALDDDWSWFWDVSLLLDYGFALMAARGVPDWAPPSLVGTQLTQQPETTRPIQTAGAQPTPPLQGGP